MSKNKWRYERDGERHDRTYYAVRENESAPCGVERIDFSTAELARAFVQQSNKEIENDKP